MVYRKLPDKIENPGPLLGVMRTCRQAMIRASSTVKPMGTTYHGLSMVMTAIDALAGLLIRRPDYFWAQGSRAASEDEKESERLEREAEAGLRPWQDGVRSRISAPQEQTVDDIIADCGDDPRAAVIELLPIIRSLISRKPNAARGRVAGICTAPTHSVWSVAAFQSYHVISEVDEAAGASSLGAGGGAPCAFRKVLALAGGRAANCRYGCD
jgi:hypothetical protein